MPLHHPSGKEVRITGIYYRDVYRIYKISLHLFLPSENKTVIVIVIKRCLFSLTKLCFLAQKTMFLSTQNCELALLTKFGIRGC